MKRTLQLILNPLAAESIRVPGARTLKYKWFPPQDESPYIVDLFDQIEIEISPDGFELTDQTVSLFFLPLANGTRYHAFSRESTDQLEDGIQVGAQLLQGNKLGPFEAVRPGPEFVFVLQIRDQSGAIKWFSDPQMNVDQVGGGDVSAGGIDLGGSTSRPAKDG